MVAVLSDEPPPQLPDCNKIAETAVDVELPTPAKSKPKSRKTKVEQIKLKIKTNAKLKNNNDKVNDQETVKPKTTRSSRQQRAKATVSPSPIEKANTNIPEIGTANYELYQALTAEEKDFDISNSGLDTHLLTPEVNQSHSTQPAAEVDVHLTAPPNETQPNTDVTPVDTTPTVLSKKRGARAKAKPVKNTQVPTTVVQEEQPIPKKIRGRRNQVVEPIPVVEESGRRRITAAAKKHYIESNESPTQPIVVQLPPEPQQIENPVPAIEVVNEVSLPKTRGRKGKKVIDPPVEAIVPSTPTRSARATRHNTNGNMMQVSHC